MEIFPSNSYGAAPSPPPVPMASSTARPRRHPSSSRFSARSLERHRWRTNSRQPSPYFANSLSSPIIISDDDDLDESVLEEENEYIVEIFPSTTDGAASTPPVSFVSSTDRPSSLGRQRRRINAHQFCKPPIVPHKHIG